MIDELTTRPWSEPRLLIDGALTASRSGALFDNIDPATGAVIGSTADAGFDDMDAGDRRRPPGVRRHDVVHRPGVPARTASASCTRR